MRQSADSAFVQLLNPVRDEEHMPDDVQQIAALANTHISGWPKDYIKLYFATYLANQENKHCIIDNGACFVLVNETILLSNTAKHPTVLKIGVGARVLLTGNSISDRLIIA